MARGGPIDALVQKSPDDRTAARGHAPLEMPQIHAVRGFALRPHTARGRAPANAAPRLQDIGEPVRC